MEARDGSTSNRDECEGEYFAAEDGAEAVGELRQRRHQGGRMHYDDAECERDDRSNFDERGEVVARREQQPDRQHRGEESVADDPDRQRGRVHHEVMSDAPAFDVASAEDREHHETDAER
jgi:hypothetical protein